MVLKGQGERVVGRTGRCTTVFTIETIKNKYYVYKILAVLDGFTELLSYMAHCFLMAPET